MSQLNIRKSLNKAFLKVKPNRTQIEEFKKNLIQLIDRTNDIESEEFHKNLVSDFLKHTYYDPEYFINTKGRNDLVIHTGKTAKTPVGVIVEAKKPTNRAEMLTNANINSKAFQELVLYFLRERITYKNLEIKNLVASNINEWFVFDANVFEKKFAQNKKLVKQFEDFEAGRLAGKTTDFFYKEIAQPFIEPIKGEIEYTYFDLRDYEKPLRNDDPKDDSKLIALFKILSPEHLLKLPFVNDSNSLDKKFYAELLHIIGLTETKEKGKKVIERKPKGERNEGALLENAIVQLDVLDKISRLDKPSQYGETTEERLFNVGLELSITWVNRILFLKLLEAQLISYHKGDKAYSFLNIKKISDYDALNRLFFQVLARRVEDRREEIAKEFEFVPYLNSSLFEPNEMEHNTILISNLMDEKTLPILSNTVLKDATGKKRKGELNAIEYFFEFLDAYDFSSEGKEDIQEDNKTLINASVLGLIFEKINGYKDGSFFTPGFITMYMCRETIRRSVVQKFREAGYQLSESSDLSKSFNELYDKIEDRQEANNIINSLKICDPAVGSGHFLVSALNEIIAIKNDLKILQDREGRRLKEYQFEVVNDELIVTDEDGEFFEYSPSNKESQRVQETLFHEKQTIIENCLFGVDINPNSVKICRLRLWVELLKHTYYKTSERHAELDSASAQSQTLKQVQGDGHRQLETLPNIDINIKCGNSLISRFDLDADIKEALKKSRWNIESYKNAVNSYRNAQSKEEKHEMERLINDIKNDFRSEISKNDPKLKRLYKLNGELANLTTQTSLFDMAAKEKKAWKKKVEKLTADTQKLETEIEEIKNNKIYENAFEWRFEFPEVLNEQGEFIGFDTVIGNPPWGANVPEASLKFIKEANSDIIVRMTDTFMFFINLSFKISSKNALVCQIVPDVLLYQVDNERLRKKILLQTQLLLAVNLGDNIFEDVARPSCIVLIRNRTGNSNVNIIDFKRNSGIPLEYYESNQVNSEVFKLLPNTVIATRNIESYKMLARLSFGKLMDFLDDEGIQRGVSPDLKQAFIVDDQVIEQYDLEVDYIFPTVTGGRDVSRYYSRDIGKRIIYTKKSDDIDSIPNIVKYISQWQTEITCKEVLQDKHPIWALHRARDKKVFDKPEKLIGVVTGDKITISIDNCYLYPTDGLYIFNSNGHYSNLFILGLLNAKLSTYLYRLISMEENRTLAQVKPTLVQELPLKSGFNEVQVEHVESKVSQILSLKKEDPNTDTSQLESEIDQMVYELYGLTEEEIAIVEEAVK